MNEVDARRARLVPGWVTVCNKPTRSTQPCIPPGSLNRVPCSFGWGKGGNVTSAGWQVTLCDPMWHVSSRSGVSTLRTAIHLLLTYLLTRKTVCDTGLRSFVNGWITTSEERRAARHTISTKPKSGPRCPKVQQSLCFRFRTPKSHAVP